MAEWWSWAPVLTSNANTSPPGPFLPFTEHPSQEGTVLLQPGKGPRKMTVDLVTDGSG